MEHRQAHREPSEIMVLLSTADGVTRKGCIKNISSLGAAIVVVSGTLPRGTIVDIRLSPLDSKQRMHRLRTRGYVVRVAGNEFGLLWVSEDALSPVFNNSKQHDADPDNNLLIA